MTCDNCRQERGLIRNINGRWICGDCWDPFGTFDQVSEPASRRRIDKRGHVMIGAHLKMRAAQGAGAGNSNESSGLTTLNELVRSSDHG